MKKWWKKWMAILTAVACWLAGGSMGMMQENLPELCWTAAANSYGLQLEYDYLEDGTVQITRLVSTTATAVYLPQTIDEKPVTAIGLGAFQQMKGLKFIEIPDTVTKIGDRAFTGCISLQSMILPNSLTEMGTGVFDGCTGLQSMILPGGLTSIGNKIFSGCTHMTEITIPNSITSIGRGAFYYCNKLTDVYYTGTESEWQQITMAAENEPLKNATIHYSAPTGGSTEFTLSDLNMKADDILHLNVSGDADDTVQAYFHYIDQNGTESFAIDNLDGVILDSDGKATIDFIAPNDLDSVTIKMAYRKSVPTYTYSVEHKIITTTAPTTTTESTTTTIITSSDLTSFQWGRDNWNFMNTKLYFTHGDYYISEPYWEKLRSNLNNTEWEQAKEWKQKEWRGSCQGMAVLVILANAGLLPYSDWTATADCLYEMQTPAENAEIESLINYYYLLQAKDTIQQQYRTVPSRSNQENIQEIISLLEEGKPVLVGFGKEGWGGHSVVAYDVNYGSWTRNGVTYQGRIEILNPTLSKSYHEQTCIYFNTSTYNWAIPYYQGITSAEGAKFNYIGNNVAELNDGGYLSGTTYTGGGNYIARLDTAAVSNNHDIQKVKYIGNQFVNQATEAGEIVPYTQYYASGESEGMPGYFLKDAEAGYCVSQDIPVPMDLSLKYENCLLDASSAAGKKVIFDKDGYVSVEGEAADYAIRMVYNEGYYTTDWYTIQVSGNNADTVIMEQIENGYLLHANHLQNVYASAHNDNFTAEVTFTTDYTDVLLYEIDEKTIGVAVDTDGDGTYETTIAQSSSEESEIVTYGDVNMNGVVDLTDVITINKHLANIIQLSSAQEANADCYLDHTVDDEDANTLLQYVILLIDQIPVQG